MTKMYIGLHVKYTLLLDFNESLICRQIFEKYWNIKFHENLFSRSRVVSRGRADGRTERETQTDRQMDINDEVNGRFSQFCERT